MWTSSRRHFKRNLSFRVLKDILMRLRPQAFVLPSLLGVAMAQTYTAAEPFRDPKLPLEQRVDDLVSRLTLDEKIAMPRQVQPAIPRRGIKAFTNFTEGLHGLGGCGVGALLPPRSRSRSGWARHGTRRYFARLGRSKVTTPVSISRSTMAPASASSSAPLTSTW